LITKSAYYKLFHVTLNIGVMGAKNSALPLMDHSTHLKILN